MLHRKLMSIVTLALALSSSFAMAEAAPAFSAVDSTGKKHTLSDYSDKTVVLEWKNHECPFVKKHYSVGNMQALQKTYTQKGVVWLSVISSAEGKQGHVTGSEANAIAKKEGSAATAILLDTKGEMGKLYGAKTTPHMFVLHKGQLVYQGAIDSKPSTDSDDIAGATNYVAEALDAVLAGQAVKTASTESYGCGVKY